MSRRVAFERLLAQTGGWYILIVIAAAQVISILGAIPGILSIQANADFNEELTRAFRITVPLLIVLSNVILLGISWQITRSARNRLDQWAKGALRPNLLEELAAWQEITSLLWRYGIAAVIVIFTINILPP